VLTFIRHVEWHPQAAVRGLGSGGRLFLQEPPEDALCRLLKLEVLAETKPEPALCRGKRFG
jgi:hypothetical protein